LYTRSLSNEKMADIQVLCKLMHNSCRIECRVLQLLTYLRRNTCARPLPVNDLIWSRISSASPEWRKSPDANNGKNSHEEHRKNEGCSEIGRASCRERGQMRVLAGEEEKRYVQSTQPRQWIVQRAE